MKTNIATTQEQSLRLLRCGVSADTADMCWHGAIVPRGGSLTSMPEPSEEWDLLADPYSCMPEEMQAAKWLRNKCGLHVAVYPCMDSASDADGQVCDEWQFWFFDIMQVSTARFLVDGEGQFDSYEQALSEGIKSALELIKKGV